jgi:glycine/D-amino acid oxidase-like deaminating enzyme
MERDWGMSAELGARSAEGPADAVVIGGGIAGCTLAYELARRAIRTVILEQTLIAAESSGRNTGTLLSGPEPAVVEMLDASAEIYEELAEGAVPFEFDRIGHLLISEDDASFEAAATVADRYRAAGVEMEKLSGADLARDYPRIGFNVAGGYSVGRAWTLEPMGATHAFAHAARQAGATVKTGLRVAQIFSRNGKVEGVLTDQGIIAADLVFIANGLWMSDLLRRTVGDGPLPGLPFTAGRGWLIQLGKLDFELPWIVEEFTWPDQDELGRRMRLSGLADVADQRDDQPAVEAICLNPMRGGDARLGASVQPAFRDLIRNTDMASRIAGRTLRMLPGLGSPQVKNVYPGNRPMLSDGLPVAGKTSIDGLFVHGGMGSIGMHAAPATARWLVDALLAGEDNPAQAWLRPDRFPGWKA